MTNEHHSQDITTKNEQSLQTLVRSLQLSQGQFSLILLRCNYADVRKRMVKRLHQLSPVPIREIHLPASVKTLYTTIVAELGNEQPPALMVFGLESVKDLDIVLRSANQVREEFRKNFPFPVLLWVNDQVLQKLIRLAPDLETWTTTTEFAIASDELLQFIQQSADEVFAKVLEAGAGRFLDNATLNLAIDSARRVELESAQQELQNRGVKLDPEIEASLEFVLGRDAGTLEQSRQHYERSLELWQQSTKLEQRGCVLHSLGLWWRTYAVQHLAEQIPACTKAKEYFQQCIEVFEQANRPDLVAKFINALGEVLQKLEQWDELEKVAKKALTLYQSYPDWFRRARSFGFLAEVALHKSAWIEAKEAAEQALGIVANPEADATSADLDWVRQYHQGWYLFALARAQQHLNQVEEAIQTLETARAETKPQYDPELYIQILCELRDINFKQGKYLTAFEFKQEQRSIEQQYGFRAFIGAGRLQAKQQIINPSLAVIEQKETVTEEISASGRQQDVNRLVERMGRDDHKLTVIYGQSGVGKSSIVQAGLIPTLKSQPIRSRDVFPILLQVYTDWIQGLGLCVVQTLEEMRSIPLNKTLDSTAAIIEQLRQNDERNLLTVLIFDQFEEFFFIYKETKQRLPFYEFFRECLNIPYVKVILSLREDYLHYLLEFNRLTMLEVINNNILDKLVLYYLGNFTPEDTKSVIQNLTHKTQLVLEQSLIDELVKDLAGDIGEVRPIELQVVGAQLQTDKITTLEQYRQHGSKEKLVGKFLEEVVKDCGVENEQIAKLVLYLLTDENNTRPLKTRGDLELELEVKEKLDLVLEILVKSGIILRVPTFPKDRYQLVHDYLVPFVRQQQSARLIEELEKEREQRKLTEAKLNDVLREQLQEARRGLVWKVTLGSIATGLAILLPLVLINQNNAQLVAMNSKSREFLQSNDDIEALIESLKAGKLLRQWWAIGVKPETRMQVIAALQDVAFTVRERNTLEGHSDSVTSVSFSPNGRMLVSGDANGTLIFWNSDTSQEISSFKAHDKAITNLSFSSDGKVLISASEDKTVKVWSLDGKHIKTFIEHQEKISSVNLSPNGQMLVSGSADGTLIIWNFNTSQRISSFKADEQAITNVSFSPDGKLIASVSGEQTLSQLLTLWSFDGKKIKRIKSYADSRSINDLNFYSNSNGNITSSDVWRGTMLWRPDGSSFKPVAVLNNGSSWFDGQTMISVASQESRYLHRGDAKIIDASMFQIDSRKNVNFSLRGHSNQVTTLSINPDGKLLASGSEDKTVKLWSLESRGFITSDNSAATKVSFSPDSKIVASVSKNEKVQLSQRNGSLNTTLPGRNSMVSFSADSQMLVSASYDSTMQIWRRDGTPIKTLQGEVLEGSFSPDGRTIALVKNDNKVELSTSDGTSIKTLEGHKDRIYKISFSPDGETFATLSQDQTIKLWRRDGTVIKSLELRNYIENIGLQLFGETPITDIGLSRNGRTLAISAYNNTVIFLRWDGKVIKNLKSDNIKSVSFSPDNDIVAIQTRDNQNKDKVELWRIDGTFLKTLEHQAKSSEINDVYFTPDSQTIVTKNNDKVYVWNRNGILLSTFAQAPTTATESFFSPDFQTQVTYEKNTVKLWKQDGSLIKTIKLKSDKTANVRGVRFSPNGEILAIFTNESTLEVWSINGTYLATLQGLNDNKIERVGFHPWYSKLPISFSSDSQTIAIRTAENTVQFWRIDSKQSKKVLGQGDLIEDVKSIPNSNNIAIVGGDDTVKIWRLAHEKGKQATLLHPSFQGHSNPVTSVSFSPNNQLIASASWDKTVKLWELNGRLLKNFTGHKDKVNSVSFSPDGKLIASSSDDKTVKLWQPNGTVIKTFDEHGNGVTSVTFSRDGKMIASGSKDNTVKIWSLDSKEVKTLNHDEPVTSVSVSPDGKMIAAAGKTKVRLWSIDGTVLTTFQRLGSQDVSFSADGKSIAAAGDTISVWNFDLKDLLNRGCDAARDYLQNNPKAKSDRRLCDDFYTKK